MNSEYLINVDPDYVFIRVARHMQPRIQGWWIQLFAARNSKGDPRN